MSLMDELCMVCQAIDLRKIAANKLPSFQSPNIDHHWNKDEVTRAGYSHLPNAQLLIQSAENCSLCAVLLKIADGLFRMRVRKMQLHVTQKMSEDTLLPLPIKLGATQSHEAQASGALGLHTLAIAVPFANLELPPSHAPYVHAPLIGVCAAKGSYPVPYADGSEIDTSILESAAALCGDVIGRPAFESADSPGANDWLRGVLFNCFRLHSKCKVSMSGSPVDEANGTRLPTRVVKVNHDASEGVRLFVTDGSQRGRYAALSHCWGPYEKRPIRTLKSNAADHEKEIPLHSQGATNPKTFQDAITVTRQLGIQYLWIGSLCIIQDDPSDWQQEGANMDKVYQNAFVTIVAAHAEDGTAGCFYDRSRLSSTPAADIPYRDRHGNLAGTIQIRARLPELFVEEHPTASPVRSRAWVTQEEFLSRRKVYYTRGRLFWVCREIELAETNEVSSVESMKWDWDQVVKEYTSRQLTYPRDKLVAIQGLANAMGTMRNDDVYVHGLWLKDFPRGLLWFGTSDRNLEPIVGLDLPSWSWASRNGSVAFLQLDPFTAHHKSCPFNLQGRTITLSAALIPLLGAEPTSIPTFSSSQSQMPQVHGSIFRWPLGIGDVEPLLRAKIGVLFPPAFDSMSYWLAAQTTTSFRFHPNRSYLIADCSKRAIGYATLDVELSETGEYYYVVPLVEGYKWEQNQDWKFAYATVLQTLTDKRALTRSPDISLCRVGVAIIMSNYWSRVEQTTTISLY